MKQSNFLNINLRDTLRSFLVAFLTFLAYWVQESFLPDLGIPDEVKAMISAAIGYLIKNFLTKPATEIKRIGGSNPPVNKDEK